YCAGIGEYGNIVLTGQAQRATGVIAMLVRQQDRAERRWRDTKAAQPSSEQTRWESRIHQHRRLAGLHEERVPTAAAAQGDHAHRDRSFASGWSGWKNSWSYGTPSAAAKARGMSQAGCLS